MGPEPGRRQDVAEEIAHVMIRFLRERMGRGPEGYRTYLVDDMIMIRLFRALTPVEYELAKTAGGQRSVKDTRKRLIQDLRPSLEELIKRTTDARVVSVHSDLSTKTGERIIILVLDRKVADLRISEGGRTAYQRGDDTRPPSAGQATP